MIKILGIIDLFAAFLLLAVAFNTVVPLSMLIFALIILFFKSLISLFSIGGMIDLGTVVLLILSIFITIPSVILFIAAALIGQKGIISLFS